MGTVSHLDNADNDKSLFSSVTSCGVVSALQLKVVQLKIQKYCTLLKATENVTISVLHF